MADGTVVRERMALQEMQVEHCRLVSASIEFRHPLPCQGNQARTPLPSYSRYKKKYNLWSASKTIISGSYRWCRPSLRIPQAADFNKAAITKRGFSFRSDESISNLMGILPSGAPLDAIRSRHIRFPPRVASQLITLPSHFPVCLAREV
jgi:hypothetical protein